MPKFIAEYPSGATPIDPDEMKDLIPNYISTMKELNQLEQANIADAFVWVGRQNFDSLLSVTFLMRLHENMFGQVWKWAGKMRRSNKNMGVPIGHIMNDVGNLLKNTQYWIDNNTFPIDEIAARFHHRLVQVHIFANGNGRHARLMADILLEKNGAQRFSWGSLSSHSSFEVEGIKRSEYILALKKADQGSYFELIKFARS